MSLIEYIVLYFLIGLGWTGWRFSTLILSIHEVKKFTSIKEFLRINILTMLLFSIFLWPIDFGEKVIIAIKRMR